MIQDYPDLNVTAIGTEKGYVLTFQNSSSRHYILSTQRDKIRFFKSASTLIKYLSDLGAQKVTFDKINLISKEKNDPVI